SPAARPVSHVVVTYVKQTIYLSIGVALSERLILRTSQHQGTKAPRGRTKMRLVGGVLVSSCLGVEAHPNRGGSSRHRSRRRLRQPNKRMAWEFRFVLEGARFLPGEGAGMGTDRALSRARGRLWPQGALLICATLLATGVQAATVTSTADDGPGSLRQVVMEAADGE